MRALPLLPILGTDPVRRAARGVRAVPCRRSLLRRPGGSQPLTSSAGSPRSLLVACWLLLACCTPLPAQTTWIVDANNGPGASFTDLPPAVQQASTGDVIRVRPGTYSAATIAKGITIFGAGWSATRVAALTVAGLPAAEIAGISDLELTARGTGLDLVNCAGVVVVERVRFAQNVAQQRYRIDRSARVYLTDCSFTMVDALPTVVRSSVVATRCTFDNALAVGFLSPYALAVTGGEVTLLDCRLASRLPIGGELAPVQMDGGTLVVGEGTVLGAAAPAGVDVVGACPTVRIGTTATTPAQVTNGCATVTSGPVAAVAAPALVANTQPSVQGYGRPNGALWVGAGEATPRGTLLPLGRAWVDLGAPVVSLGVLVLDGSGRGSLPLFVPPLPRGLVFVFQGVELGPPSALRATAASAAFTR